MMKERKIRFSIPARILELLYTDDSFFNEVLKIKKTGTVGKFPKSDEWRDEDGFNLSFALAGYSPEDVLVEVEENVLVVRGIGLDSIDPTISEILEPDDTFQGYSNKESRPRIHIGTISRGIARRKFCTKYLISEEFDIESAEALMEHGLLHIFIPNKQALKHKVIVIKDGKK